VTQKPEDAYAASDALVAADDAQAVAVVRREEARALAVPVQSYAPVKGVHTRTVWKARLDDLTKLPREILEETLRGKVGAEALASNLNARARLANGPSNTPGVTFYEDDSIVKGRH
jgi:hypothetical protein